jgi:hypothetical protein
VVLYDHIEYQARVKMVITIFALAFFIGSVSLCELREEDAVTLPPNLSEDGSRGIRRVGNELETLLFCRPVKRCRILNVVANEVVCFIARVDSLYHAAPTKLEGDGCRYMVTIHQGIGNVEVVLDIRVTDDHRGCGIVEVDLHSVIGDAKRPEQAARSNTGVKVVDLICRNHRPLIEIQSDEAEGAMVFVPIHPDVGTLHEAHISIEVEGLMVPCKSVDSYSSTLDICNTNGAFEVGDR